jgi:Spy/CpxP family protein refolding chaperone
MKTSKYLLSFLLLSASTAVYSAYAEEPAPPASAPSDHPKPFHPRMRERRMKQLTEKLQLTSAQQAQINAIWDKAAAQGRDAMDDAADARADARAKVRDIMKTTRDEVRAVLTPEQQKTFDEMPKREGRRGPRGEHPKPAEAPPAPQS